MFRIALALVLSTQAGVALAAGACSVTGTAFDAAGHPVPSGVYFVRVQSGDDVRSQRLVVAR